MTHRPLARRHCPVELLESRQLLSALPVVLRVNAGGDAYTDSIARAFAADSGFTGGTAGQTTATITGSSDATLFQSWRQGASFSFHSAVANGNYSLFLEFADPVSTAAGQHTMDITAEGSLVLDDYDIFASAGTAAATAWAFDINIADNALDLTFTAVTGVAMVSAIVLVPTDLPQGMPGGSGPGEAADAGRSVMSMSNLRELGQAVQLYANEHRGSFPAALTDVFPDYIQRFTTFANPRTSTQTPRAELTTLEQVAWVRGHNDYLYRPGLRWTSPITEIVAYENPTRMAGVVNALFVDGHVESLTRTDAAARLGFDPSLPTDPPPAWVAYPVDLAVFKSQSNLRTIAQGLQYYAYDHSSRLPTLLSDVYTYGQVPLGVFANPRNPAPIPNVTGDAAAAWIDSGANYVYLGAGMALSASATTVLAYENPSPMALGINFAFVDGRVEFREMRWAVETLSRATGGWGLAGIDNPIANIAGRYRTAQGTPVQVAGAGVRVALRTSSSTLDIYPITAYEWDFDYNGSAFDVDATGQSPVVPAAQLQAVGTRTVALRVRDSMGNVSNIATTTLDVTTMPAITAIIDDTGISDADGITSDPTVVIRGVADPLAAVEVYRDGTPIGTASADASGAWTFDYTGTTLDEGNATFTVHSGGVTSAPFAVRVDTTAPTVTAWSINGGAAQRSMVRRLDVTFSEPVRMSSGTISIQYASGQYLQANVFASNPSADGMNWTISFFGTGIIGGSLPDGIYDLKIGRVQDCAGNLSSGVITHRFHRLFGDINGDKRVNMLDHVRMRTALGRSAGQPLFNAGFDYNGNGTIDLADYSQFRRNFGRVFAY